MAAQRASILPHAPHEFPEQRFGGITSLLVFLRRRVRGVTKSTLGFRAVTMRGPAMVAGSAGLLSVTTASTAGAVCLGGR